MSTRTTVRTLLCLGALAVASALTACGGSSSNAGDATADTAGDAGDAAGDTVKDSTVNPDETTQPDGATDSDGSDGSDGVVLPQCKTNSDCAGVDAGPCRRATCDTVKSLCRLGDLPDGTPCTADACKSGQVCAVGACGGGTAAAPDCGAHVCGTDLCGNACGTCAAGATCNADGQCDVVPCGDVPEEGCCTADGTLRFCEAGGLMTLECAAGGTLCGWDGPNAFYDCAAPSASPEPTGAVPYLCAGETCANACADRECGFDCGESCGTCGEGKRCSDAGTCEDCTCDGKSCGDDGCGKACGTCGSAELCEDNVCVANLCGDVSAAGCCTPASDLFWCEDGALQTIACAGNSATCGWSAENAFYNCGEAPAGDPAGEFPRGCPDLPEPCGGFSPLGCCDGDTVRFCEDGAPDSIVCQDGCGWEADGRDGAGWYNCGGAGADPSGVNPLSCQPVVGPVDEDPEVAPDAPPETVEMAPDVVEDTAPDAANDTEVVPDTANDSAPDSENDTAEIGPDVQDATGDTAPTPITAGACTNATDYPLWYHQKPEDAFFTCVASAGVQNTAAVETCMVSATGLSAGCVGCYGAALECGKTQCSVCVTKGIEDPECEACFGAQCVPGLSACTGL